LLPPSWPFLSSTADKLTNLLLIKIMLTKKTIKIILAFTLLLIFFLGYHHYYTQSRMVVFDVGQGDAIFFRTADGEDVLIDGGPDKTVLSKLDRYMPFWDRNIELMILTHPHADHVYGLNEVLKRYNVEMVMMTGVTYHEPG
jgi:competence protein ComEC